MEELLRYGLIALSVLGVFYLARRNANKAEQKMTLDHFTIKYSNIYLWVGVLCFLLFTTIFILSLTVIKDESSTFWIQLGFGGFALLGLFLTYSVLRFKIHINGNKIIVIPSFGKKKEYTFDEIERVKLKQSQFSELKVYIKNKKAFTVTEQHIGYNLLKKRLESHLPNN